jgi:uncharacterized protein YdhG (YjbR/CyaY superfamily)
MNPKKTLYSIDEYLAAYPQDVQALLKELRQAIKEAAPQAQETISYQMPAFRQNGILVWFGAFKDHIGFFPKASAVKAFKKKLSGFKTSKGTVQFALDKPIPLGLVKEIVRFRVKESLKKNKALLKSK